MTLKGVVQKWVCKLEIRGRLHRNVNKVGQIPGYHFLAWIPSTCDVHSNVLKQMTEAPIKIVMMYGYLYTGWHPATELPELQMEIPKLFGMCSDQVENIERNGYMIKTLEEDVVHDWNFNIGIYYFSKKDVRDGYCLKIRHRFKKIKAVLPHGMGVPWEDIGRTWNLVDNGVDKMARLKGPKGFDMPVWLWFEDVSFQDIHNICFVEFCIVDFAL